MTKAYKAIVILMLTAYFVTGLCKENNEQSRTGIEYMQIFRNIPTLFEYLLAVLQQRVEILERDDVSVFLEKSDDSCDNDECVQKEVKRETGQFLDGIDTSKTVGEITGYYTKNYHGVNTFKKLNSIVEIHEYGRAKSQYSNTNTNNFNASKEPDNDKAKREITKNELIDKPFTKSLADVENYNLRSIMNERAKTKRNRSRITDLKLEKPFIGKDWSLFNVSPEEVEEKAIRTEQMIEDYNKKNRKK